MHKPSTLRLFNLCVESLWNHTSILWMLCLREKRTKSIKNGPRVWLNDKKDTKVIFFSI